MDTLVNDTIIQLNNSTIIDSKNGVNLWIYVSIFLGLAIIGLLLSKNEKQSKRTELKEKILAENTVDFSNVINSSFQAKALYDELKKQCHPDKYKDEALNAEATEIFQLLVKHKYDYKKLLELKERAIRNLKIS